jgi:hypothetical protein
MKRTYLKKYIQEELHRILEIFDRPLPNVDKISPSRYIVSNGKDIEAEYYFRRIDIDSDKWVIAWSFTDDNKNTTSEAWKQVTATSFRVLSDFIQNRHPRSIEISGNTDSKTNIYKSPSFVNKLQDLFNNQYKIGNTPEYSVIMNLIEKVAESSIKKRMESMNETYQQATNYWKNGDLATKSKIERVNTVKKLAKRTILEYLYVRPPGIIHTK